VEMNREIFYFQQFVIHLVQYSKKRLK